MMMALVHDIVEIDAGDTYAYDAEGLATQAEREATAAERIFGILPEDQKNELKGLFEEFDACETPEARFAKVMDNLQPFMLNNSNNGMDWKEHGVCKSQVYRRNKRTSSGSEEIWKYMQEVIEQNVKKGSLKAE